MRPSVSCHGRNAARKRKQLPTPAVVESQAVYCLLLSPCSTWKRFFLHFVSSIPTNLSLSLNDPSDYLQPFIWPLSQILIPAHVLKNDHGDPSPDHITLPLTYDRLAKPLSFVLLNLFGLSLLLTLSHTNSLLHALVMTFPPFATPRYYSPILPTPQRHYYLD